MATIATLSKTGPDVGGSPGWNPELLPHQSTFRGRGSHQRQHQNPSQKGPRLQKSRLPTAQGAAHGGHKNGIHRSSESSLKCGSPQILVQSLKNKGLKPHFAGAKWGKNAGGYLLMSSLASRRFRRGWRNGLVVSGAALMAWVISLLAVGKSPVLDEILARAKWLTQLFASFFGTWG